MHIHNWNGCDTLNLPANLLRRNIFFIAKSIDGDNDWQCSLYRSISLSSCKKIVETEEQLILTAAECGRLIAQDKKNEDG